MSCKGHFKELHDVIAELIKNVDAKTVQSFNQAISKKLEELHNEQAANLQENTGASR